MEPTVLAHRVVHNFPAFRQTNIQNDETPGRKILNNSYLPIILTCPN